MNELERVLFPEIFNTHFSQTKKLELKKKKCETFFLNFRNFDFRFFRFSKNVSFISMAQGKLMTKICTQVSRRQMCVSNSLNSGVSVFGIISEERPTITLTYQYSYSIHYPHPIQIIWSDRNSHGQQIHNS